MGDEDAFLIELEVYPPDSDDAALLQMVAGVHPFLLIEPTLGAGLATLKIVSSSLYSDLSELGDLLIQLGKELKGMADGA